MTCHKCGGLLFLERFLGLYPQTDRWKCLNCGVFKKTSSTPSSRNRTDRDGHLKHGGKDKSRMRDSLAA